MAPRRRVGARGRRRRRDDARRTQGGRGAAGHPALVRGGREVRPARRDRRGRGRGRPRDSRATRARHVRCPRRDRGGRDARASGGRPRGGLIRHHHHAVAALPRGRRLDRRARVAGRRSGAGVRPEPGAQVLETRRLRSGDRGRGGHPSIHERAGMGVVAPPVPERLQHHLGGEARDRRALDRARRAESLPQRRTPRRARGETGAPHAGVEIALAAAVLATVALLTGLPRSPTPRRHRRPRNRWS